MKMNSLEIEREIAQKLKSKPICTSSVRNCSPLTVRDTDQSRLINTILSIEDHRCEVTSNQQMNRSKDIIRVNEFDI